MDGQYDEKRRKKKKTKRRNDDDEDGQRRRKKSKKKKRRRDSSSSSSSSEGFSSSSSSSAASHHEDRKRKKKKKERKKDTKKKKKRKRDKKERKQPEDDPFARNHVFATSLCRVLEDHPGLASDLPIMLIRMAGGTSFDLSQMSDMSAANGLQQVFESLTRFGVERDGKSGWTWKPPVGGRHGANHELILIQIARSLLDQIGVTMEAVDNYGKPKAIASTTDTPLVDDSKPSATPQQSAGTYSVIQKQTMSLLDRFLSKDSTLANQIGDICNMIMGGESISLDGIADQNLREGLEQLFRGAGLERAVMDDDDDDDNDSDEEAEMGYGLPDSNSQFALSNLDQIVSACKDKAAAPEQMQQTKRAMKGPLPQHLAHTYQEREEESEEDDAGPAPLGAVVTRKGLSTEAVRAMADQRLGQQDAILSDQPIVTTKPGEREEWMVNPGEHDLLQGIKSGSMKNRNFENKKAKAVEAPEAPIDPSVQAEVDAILEAHSVARGPSLMEQHRERTAAAKAETKADGQSFGWSRNKDLDAGRRVDKEALRLLMGGAGSGLKDKFQGGLNKT